MIFKRIRHRFLVWERLSELNYLISTSKQVRVAWLQEQHYIETTDRLDWVDPNPLKVHPSNYKMKPPPVPRRYTDK